MVNIDSENRPHGSGWKQASIALPTEEELRSIIESTDHIWLNYSDIYLLNVIEGFARAQGRAMKAEVSAMGLGDKLIFLRHVAGYARHFPDRQFFLQPSLVPELNVLNLPSK